ncbi:MAG: DUF4412 domain-containing protein [Flavobacteriales bacterium]|nr:DUF4412 domain-containing protein [Flavobacteriales bacterium]
MKKLGLIIAVFAILISSISSSYGQFEGEIRFKKQKNSITEYSYFVKGDRVRVEEYGTDGSTKGVMLVDLKSGTVTALSPDRKLFMDATNDKVPSKAHPQLTKTGNSKTINGMKCSEWTARSEKEQTQVVYWVIDDAKYPFFEKLLRTLNRKDRLSKYWLELPGIENQFTMVGIEKTLEGAQRTKLEVIKMSEETISESMFSIPKDYVKFEK